MRASAPIRRTAKQRGLTLIELVVVLTILVALGSLLVPIIGNALTRSHVATCSSSIPEISGMLLRKEALSGDFGDGWSTGVATTVTTAGATASINGANVEIATADDVTALNAAGITNVFDHDTSVTDYNVTFNNGQTTEALAATTALIVLTPAQETALNLDAAGRYVWLGIDKQWEGVGVDTPEPPVHYGDTEGFYPHQVYSRFGAIFQVAGASGGLDKAKFVQVSYSLGDTDGTPGAEFETADNHIAIHWQEVFNN